MLRSRARLAILALAPCLLGGAGCPASRAACTLTTQWRWDGLVRDPANWSPASTPLVVQLTDDDGDGVIGPRDDADVVFQHGPNHSGVLSAVNGRDGSDIFTIPDPQILEFIAAGDLDGDGVVEIVGFGGDFASLVAFRADGSLDWQVPIPIVASQNIGIADIDQDGTPEIYFRSAVYSASGSLRWEGTDGSGRHPLFSMSTSIAADLLPSSPGLELVAGNTCYASDGSVAWTRPDLPDGLASVGDLDGDGAAEIVLVSGQFGPNRNQVHVLDRDGASLGPVLEVVQDTAAGPATLVDLDGDGRREIVMQMGNSLEAYAWTGAVLTPFWSVPMAGELCCNGASAFDIDGDGSIEIFYRGNLGFWVIDGLTGAVLHQRSDTMGGSLDVPVVADIDKDNRPEILASGGIASLGSFLTAFECGSSVPTRCIWNEHGYHVTNVLDDGRIPRVEIPPWTAGLGHLEQEARACCGSPIVPPPVVGICIGDATILDGAPFADPGCTSGSTYEWRDALGAVIGTNSTVLVSPAASTTYDVTIDCPGQPTCGSRGTIRVTVDLPPLFSSLRGREVDPCNLGIELTWDAATFRDPSGAGSYDVYRSQVSCADAATLPPVATGVTALRWVDSATRAGSSYYYVVQAEDARTTTACPQGPGNGGAVNAGLVCVGPILESPGASTPELFGWTLRGGHVGDAVTMRWPGSRALLPGEHYHVLKGRDSSSFAMVNAEGQLSTTWTETDTSEPLQFFDIRVANPCEIVSLADDPP